ncbi:MAG: hypothetical protein ACJATL_000074 [Rickettsiales bacterium]|jgi:hypothetical protein
MKSLLRYPNFLEKISKIKDKDRFKLMSSDEAKYLVRKGMVSFEELLELSNNERKFTALVFSFSADLIKSGKVEFENISELYDDNADKLEVFTSYWARYFIISGIVDFEKFSNLYDENRDKFQALASNLPGDLIKSGIVDFEQISNLYDESQDKFKAMTSDESKYLMMRGLIKFDDLSKLHDQDRKEFEAITSSEFVNLIKIKKHSLKNINKDEVEELTRDRIGDDSYGQIKKLIPLLNSTYGIEIESCLPEISPTALDSTPFGWKNVADPTIAPKRFHHKKVEHISPILDRSNLFGLGFMFAFLKCSKSYVNDSCGFHVHAGMLVENLKVEEGVGFDLIKQILVNYVALEEEGLGFPQRKYAIRSLTSRLSGKNIKEILEAKDLISLRTKTQFDKGSVVNLESMLTHGTIEFRAHSGTVNPKDILSWLTFVNELVGISLKMTKGRDGVRQPNEAEKSQLKQALEQLKSTNSCVNGGLCKKDPSSIVRPTSVFRRLKPKSTQKILK